MDRGELERHLSQMSTAWTDLIRARDGSGSGAAAARSSILERYGPAIYRYLLGATHDRDLADELFQELSVKLLRGDFRHADPQLGRFRNYLKSALRHLVSQAHRRPRARPLAGDVLDPIDEPLPDAEDEAFQRIWREELMQRTWTALKAEESRANQPLYTVLRFRTDHPESNSQQMAVQLSESLGRELSAEWVRKWLHRARQVFSELLVKDVAGSISDPSPAALEDELRDLELLDYCRTAAKDYAKRRGTL
jgi:RNA polymerase sigma-70 factor (ECF subfamily)